MFVKIKLKKIYQNNRKMSSKKTKLPVPQNTLKKTDVFKLIIEKTIRNN